MIELYELRQFVTFAKAGTLSKAAEILHLSQPALSRNMKKIEDDLGVTLFTRTKNKLTLNKNGEYLLKLAQKLLTDADSLAAEVRNFDRRNRTLSLGVCSPAPVWFLTPLISQHFSHLSLTSEQDEEKKLLSGLENNVYQLIVLPYQPEGPYQTVICGQEQLKFALPKGHKYARRKSLTLAEMNGENMLLMPDIGFWKFILNKMPASRFLTQSDRYSFNELLQASFLPSFTTDLVEKYFADPSGRIHVPISDPEAVVTYYLVCRKEEKKLFSALFAAFKSML